MSSRALVVSKCTMAGMLLGLAGMSCNTNAAPGPFLPPGDNEAVCRTISPGDEISVRVGFRGRALKLAWSPGDAKLERTGTIEKLTLVATVPSDGYVLGDTNGRFTLVVSRDGGLAISDDYRDSPLAPGQQLEHYDVAISSTPSVNGVPLKNGAGSANVLAYSRSTNRVTLRVSFRGPVLNLVTGALEDVCGEAYFDGTVELKGF